MEPEVDFESLKPFLPETDLLDVHSSVLNCLIDGGSEAETFEQIDKLRRLNAHNRDLFVLMFNEVYGLLENLYLSGNYQLRMLILRLVFEIVSYSLYENEKWLKKLLVIPLSLVDSQDDEEKGRSHKILETFCEAFFNERSLYQLIELMTERPNILNVTSKVAFKLLDNWPETIFLDSFNWDIFFEVLEERDFLFNEELLNILKLVRSKLTDDNWQFVVGQCKNIMLQNTLKKMDL